MTVPKVFKQPIADLVRWHPVRNPLGYSLAGIDPETGRARVTSPLAEFDAAAGLAVTESGRAYRLLG